MKPDIWYILLENRRGGAAAGGRVAGGAAVTSSSSPDAAGHSNRVVFLYNRVRRNLLAEEALRAQRQRLLQRAKDAMQQALESELYFFLPFLFVFDG